MNRSVIKAIAAAVALSSAASAAAYTTEPSESLEVWLGPISVVNDGKTISTLTVYEKDSVDYTAFNMAIVVPEGITIAKVKQGREEIDDIHLTDRATSSHTITCGMPDSNTIKIISGSPSLSDYFPTTEDGVDPYALFTIGLVASPDLAPGEYQLELCDVKFVLESADAFVLPEEPLLFPLKVEGAVTSVRDVTAPASDGSVTYDLQGRPVKGNPEGGVYIIKGRKVLVE